MTAVANPDLNLSAAGWDRETLNSLQLYSNNYNLNLFNDVNDTSSSSSSNLSFNKMKPADVHLMLARAIHRRKSILFAQPGRGSNVTQQRKEEEWESLRKEMVANGVSRFERKTWQTVRDVDFQQIRRKAIHRQTLAQQGHGAMPETEFDLIMMEILNSNETRFGVMEFKNENGSSPASERYTESPQNAFDPQSQAVASLLNSLINSQTGSAEAFAQFAVNSHQPVEEPKTAEKRANSNVSAAPTESSANSVHNETVQPAPASPLTSTDSMKRDILLSQLRTQQLYEKAAEKQLEKSEFEAELAKMKLEKYKEEVRQLENSRSRVVDEDDGPCLKRARTEEPSV
ncbi:unnamed protein product [Bursaphelenchus xylophilus]|uniref:(pine wood nematode) hypothetical protein n=1 Tax=Bursaphelenchus xylophilus TaxID=6326 RepID=A0A1I7S247_BURXY|nr:unnamed protein product [Bursaphelenchus xylophilus]CAG9114919.1 unnamed protein product [Bursaphelenchus xylophilus]